ncbi:hypothetical protein QAD02_013357 [Eretmocerus hayati]|uniref:Uncharacterized protein n=1 Tax=Eretmocerus hayati TaxID=131215 RepID=A0ACC2P2C0_9HYME|nr:hypothetical protein QAD02_013357 [Eretmocerus hayati]
MSRENSVPSSRGFEVDPNCNAPDQMDEEFRLQREALARARARSAEIRHASGAEQAEEEVARQLIEAQLRVAEGNRGERSYAPPPDRSRSQVSLNSFRSQPSGCPEPRNGNIIKTSPWMQDLARELVGAVRENQTPSQYSRSSERGHSRMTFRDELQMVPEFSGSCNDTPVAH